MGHRPPVGAVRPTIAGHLAADHRLVPTDRSTDPPVGPARTKTRGDHRSVLTGQQSATPTHPPRRLRIARHSPRGHARQSTAGPRLDLWLHETRGSPPRQRRRPRHAEQGPGCLQRHPRADQLEELLANLVRNMPLRHHNTTRHGWRCYDRWTPPGLRHLHPHESAEKRGKRWTERGGESPGQGPNQHDRQSDEQTRGQFQRVPSWLKPCGPQRDHTRCESAVKRHKPSPYVSAGQRPNRGSHHRPRTARRPFLNRASQVRILPGAPSKTAGQTAFTAT